MSYTDVYDGWKANPEAFWMQAAQAIDWMRPPSKALFDEQAPLYEWFSDAQVNTCWNCVDRHVEAGRGGQESSATGCWKRLGPAWISCSRSE